MKRNTMPYLSKEKTNSINKEESKQNNNKNLNPEENKDMQNNNTETKNDDIKKETENIINEENKSLEINNQHDNSNEINNDEINKKIKENINDNSFKFNNGNEKIQNDIDNINEDNSNNNRSHNNINYNNKIKNKPSSNYNVNIASNKGDSYNHQKLNSSLELSRNKKNEEIFNSQQQLKRNTMNALQFPKKKNNIINNIPLLNEKNLKNNENDVNDENNEESGKKTNRINISNGQNYINEKGNNYNYNKINGKNNNKYFDDNTEKIYNNKLNNNQILNNYNINQKDENKNIFPNETEKEEKENFLKTKINDEIKKETKRLTTEEFLENNLESNNFNTINKEKSIKEETKSDYSNINNNNNKNKISKENSYSIISKEGGKEEIIIIRQIIPVCFIQKTRQNYFKINNLIPKKKRVFISKLIHSNELNDTKDKEELSFPIINKCFMTNQYIIQKRNEIMSTIINKYFFNSKLHLKKKLEEKKEEGKEKEKEKEIQLKILKFPKVYKKAIISPNNTALFRTRVKKTKSQKNPSIIDMNNNENNNENNNDIEINIKKGRKKTEKISLISKDKAPYLNNLNEIIKKENEKNRNGNIVIRQNNKIVKELSDDIEGNQVDISILFSNKPPLGLSNKKKLKKYPVSAKKKNKNLVDSLYKDLRDLNHKIQNKDDYFKKNYLNLHYERHVGDERTCPICRQVRKRGRKEEREKGLFSAFSFRNIKKINKKSLSKLKISLQQKSKDNNFFRNNFDSNKKNYENNFFSMNNNIDTELRNKYMQFNGMNRFNKLNRYGSSENLRNYAFDKTSFRKSNLFMDKEMEKNDDNLEEYQYPALNNYFHN